MACQDLYFKVSPKTGQPVLGLSELPSMRHDVLGAELAWTAYQDCTRRMENACAANRFKSTQEQRRWWEETSVICQNAISLHNTTQYSVTTADRLELLEAAYYMIQTMLETLEPRSTSSAGGRSLFNSPSSSTSSSPALGEEEQASTRRSRRMNLSTMYSGFINNMTKDLHSLTRRLSK